MATVEFEDHGGINYFTYGQFSGWVDREPASKERWSGDERIAPKPEHWRVHLSSHSDNAWRDILLPLKRGRTKKTAVIDACNYIGDPTKVCTYTINSQLYFGDTINLLGEISNDQASK